jgi:hypothetical protein
MIVLPPEAVLIWYNRIMFHYLYTVDKMDQANHELPLARDTYVTRGGYGLNLFNDLV